MKQRPSNGTDTTTDTIDTTDTIAVVLRLRRRHRNNDGAIIAGGLAAGVIGGLIGGALANDGGPRYIDPPPPPRPRCWFEDRRVRNAYDGGWHMESLRVCQ